MGTAPVSSKDVSIDTHTANDTSKVPSDSELAHPNLENEIKETGIDPKIIFGIVFFFIAVFVAVWTWKKPIKQFFSNISSKIQSKKKTDENKKLEEIEEPEKPELDDK